MTREGRRGFMGRALSMVAIATAAMCLAACGTGNGAGRDVDEADEVEPDRLQGIGSDIREL